MAEPSTEIVDFDALAEELTAARLRVDAAIGRRAVYVLAVTPDRLEAIIAALRYVSSRMVYDAMVERQGVARLQ